MDCVMDSIARCDPKLNSPHNDHVQRIIFIMDCLGLDGMSESILAQPPLLTIDSRLDTDTRKNRLVQETNLIAR